MDFSRITDDLLIGTTPRRADFERLGAMGVRLVINMRFWPGSLPKGTHPGMQYLRLRTFDSPLILIPTEALVRGARAALRVIREGGQVYTHCSRGRHRSVAMAAAILIAQGHGPEEAMALIKQKRPDADPGAAHIRSRILKFEQTWKLVGAVQR
jgi:protein tyrosine phosphatase (PTP) superfamily phosphohydrolase (DUF442 family)